MVNQGSRRSWSPCSAALCVGVADRAPLRAAVHQVSACRASCSPWPGCSPSRARCSTCSATTARSTCPSDSDLLEFARYSSSPAAQAYAIVVADRGASTSARSCAASGSRKAAGLTPPTWWPLVLVKAVAARRRAGLPHLLRQHRPRLSATCAWLFVAAGRRHGPRAAPHASGAATSSRSAATTRRPGAPASRSTGSTSRCSCSRSTLRGARRADAAPGCRPGLAGQRHHRHQPDRDRGRRHRRHQPLRRARLGVRRAARASWCCRRSPAGLNLAGVESEVRFMVTGAVLLLAVAIDSVSRRARSTSGRG